MFIFEDFVVVIFALGNPIEELLHEPKDDCNKGEDCQYPSKRFEHGPNLPDQLGLALTFL